MAAFENVIDWVMAHEATADKIFSDSEHDPGGPTQYGISLRFLKTQGSDGDIDGDGDVDVDDIRKMTMAKAKEFARKRFWDPLSLSKLENEPLAGKVLDISFNAGPSRAAKLLQEAINVVQHPGLTKLKVDGIVGKKTIAAANKLEGGFIRSALCSLQWAFYVSIRGKKKAVFEENKNGWRRRAFA